MTHDQLIQLQNWASLAFLIFLGAGVLHLLLGLISPAWVGRKGRGTVLLMTLATWLAGAAIWAGTIAYTHSHPKGPHSAKGYIEDYFADQCARGADLPACKPATAPPTTP